MLTLALVHATHGEREDQVHLGRMILLGIGLGYLIVWILDFFYRPILLLPAAALDPSHHALFTLIQTLVQYALFGIFWIFTWAGYSWARYTLGGLFLVGGLEALILSIEIGSDGGVPLILGTMCLAGSAALLLGLSVYRYQEDRRRKGLPALAMGLSFLGFCLVLVALGGIQLAQAWVLIQTNQRQTAFEEGLFKKLIPALDLSVLKPFATEKLKQDMEVSDFPGQMDDIKKTLGAFRSWPGLEHPSVEQLILKPENTAPQRECYTLVHYEKSDLYLQIDMEFAQSPGQVTNIYFERLAPLKPGE